MNTSEHESSPGAILELVKRSENLKQEEIRSKKLAELLFHRHIDSVFSKDQIDQIEQDFLAAKKGLNMGERMELALSPQYLGIINVVELGLTEEPLEPGQIDSLKVQYHQLLNWMNENGWSVEELPRSPSSRQMTVTPSAVNPAYSVVERTRSLVETVANVTHPVDGERPVDISIAKRMIFSIPSGLYEAINKFYKTTDSTLTSDEIAEKVNKKIEEIMDGDNSKFKKQDFVYPIRTAYYLMAYPTVIINSDS